MSERDVEKFAEAVRIAKQNSTKAKRVNSMIQSTKPEALEFMKKSQRTFMVTSAGEYVVLKQKNKRPPMNDEFIATSFIKFLQQKNVPCTPTAGDEFIKYMHAIQNEHSVSTTNVEVVTDRVPVSAFWAPR